jgi:CheY-like chemotaxis protein
VKKILAVDDDKMVLELLQEYLSKTGVKVETASSGLEAIRLLKENHYDLLLTDYKMGEMNGLELVKQVQNCHPDLSIIVMSSEDSRELFKKEGIDCFFPKPLNLPQMGDTICRLLE